MQNFIGAGNVYYCDGDHSSEEGGHQTPVITMLGQTHNTTAADGGSHPGHYTKPALVGPYQNATDSAGNGGSAAAARLGGNCLTPNDPLFVLTQSPPPPPVCSYPCPKGSCRCGQAGPATDFGRSPQHGPLDGDEGDDVTVTTNSLKRNSVHQQPAKGAAPQTTDRKKLLRRQSTNASSMGGCWRLGLHCNILDFVFILFRMRDLPALWGVVCCFVLYIAYFPPGQV